MTEFRKLHAIFHFFVQLFYVLLRNGFRLFADELYKMLSYRRETALQGAL